MAIVPSQLENANITQDTARIDLLGVQSTFISFYFETAPARRFFEINTLGVAVQGINLGELRKLPIPVPSVDEQAWISDRLVVALNRLDTEIRTRNKLASQKLGLMQDLLTGKIPVKVDVPEAADA
jgi:type I restriction enzyme S subunit